MVHMNILTPSILSSYSRSAFSYYYYFGSDHTGPRVQPAK